MNKKVNDADLMASMFGCKRETAVELLELTGGKRRDACYVYYSLTNTGPEMYRVLFGKDLWMSSSFCVTVGPKKPLGLVDPQAVTEWKEVPFSTVESLAPPGQFEQCSICLCEFSPSDSGEIVLLSKCRGHFFHKSCISLAFHSSAAIKCPVCSMAYGSLIGEMPPGAMRIVLDLHLRCDGERPGTWIINYNLPSGVLENVRYKGAGREAFLPNTKEGREVMRLLIFAFVRRHTFAVGTSVTTGKSNTVVWNGIHHKTSVDGGPTNFGYPDPTYFSCVKSELSARGIAYS